jgi:hypothetical protein
MVAQFKQQTGTSVTAEFVTITPQTAKAWLGLNVANYRPLSLPWAKSLAEDIRNGRWLENGESVKFDANGNLIDGQHRLYACVLANAPFRSLVVRGVGDDVNIDTGRSRSLADILRRRGEKNYAPLSSALRWVCAYEKGGLKGVIGAKLVPTHQELLLLLERNPLIRESVTAAYSARQLMSLPIAIGLHYIFTIRSDRATADRFFDRLIDGNDLTQLDPIYHLRERLLKNLTAKAKLPREEIVALFIKAWNAWINGRAVNKLRWISVGPRAEEFPSFEDKDSTVVTSE